MSTETRPTVDPFAGLPAIFKDCSDAESVRYALDIPMVFDGRVYASDGRIAVRMPWDGPEPPEWKEMRNDRRVPRIGDVFIDDHEPEPTPIPAIPPPETRPCEECKGTGTAKCWECEGTGIDECDSCGHEDECEVCDGKGTFPCECKGEGFVEWESVPVGRLRFKGDYLAMLQRHGVTGLYLPLDTTTDAGRATKFVLGDVEGRLMPMSDR
jgi:hypothetical protein